LFATDILKVLYAPRKVFKQIIQNPKYWGVIVVIILFIAMQSAFYYSYFNKEKYETASPAGTAMGQYTENATLWTTTSGVAISYDYVDYINGSTYGNNSLQFAFPNSNSIFMTLNLNGTVNCGPDNFENLSMRIKQVDPQSSPVNVTLYLYYANSSTSYFTKDMTTDFSNAQIDAWNNLTIPVGSSASSWLNTGNAQWSNITGLKLNFVYPSEANITLRADGIFFRGPYQTLIDLTGATFPIIILENNLLQYIVQLILISILLYALIKALKGTVTLRPIMVAVGFVLIVAVIQAVIGTIAVSFLPQVSVPIETQASVAGEAQTAAISAFQSTFTTFAYVFYAVEIACYAWIAGLCAIIVREISGFNWSKSIAIAASTMTVTFIVVPIIYQLLQIFYL
jgi:hypothetical protein